MLSVSFALAFVALFFAPSANAAKAKAETATFKISNLTKATPAKDAKKVEKALKKVKGVTFVIVAKKKGEIVVKYKAGADMAAVKDAIKKAGFTVVEPKDAEGGDEAAEGGDAAGDEGGDMGGDEGADMGDDASEE